MGLFSQHVKTLAQNIYVSVNPDSVTDNQTRALVAAMLTPKDLDDNKQSELRPITYQLIKNAWDATWCFHSRNKVVGFLFMLLKEVYPAEYLHMTIEDAVNTGPGTLHSAALNFMLSQSIRFRQVEATCY